MKNASSTQPTDGGLIGSLDDAMQYRSSGRHGRPDININEL